MFSGSEDGVYSEIEVQSTSYRDTARSAGHDEITFNDTLTTQINSSPRLCFFLGGRKGGRGVKNVFPARLKFKISHRDTARSAEHDVIT